MKKSTSFLTAMAALLLSFGFILTGCNPDPDPGGDDPTAYTVTFDVDGGSAVSSQRVVSGGKVARPSPDPAKSGYTFANWYKDAGKQTVWNFDADTVTADTTIYAKWVGGTVSSYTVTFDVDGGSAVSSQSVVSGEKVTRPTPDPAKEDMTFANWYKDAEKTTLWNFDTDVITADTTIYAKWVTGTVPSYTVTFNADGGAPAPASQSVAQGEKATKPADPAKAGHTFDGWYKDADKQTPWNFDADTVTAAITIYAKWTVLSYTVTFNADGGAPVPTDQSVAWGGKATKPTDPAKSGYTFDGWYKDADKQTAWNFDADTVTAATTIYAKWVIPSYTVTFNADGGAPVPADQSVVSGGKAARPTADPAKSGYTFANWYKDAAKTTLWSFDVDVVTAGTTIYAKWVEGTVPPYTVTFDAAGGSPVPAAQSIVSGEKAAAPASPEKDGYAFSGWHNGSAAWDFSVNTVTADVTLTAQWTAVRAFTVTFSGFSDEEIGLSHEAETLSKGNWDGLTVFLSGVEDADSIWWYKDGETGWETGYTKYTVYASQLSLGLHTLSAVVVKDGAPYSKTLRFQVTD
jgi:uncharacterized repeat protein (TIGR02543 family)